MSKLNNYGYNERAEFDGKRMFDAPWFEDEDEDAATIPDFSEEAAKRRFLEFPEEEEYQGPRFDGLDRFDSASELKKEQGIAKSEAIHFAESIIEAVADISLKFTYSKDALTRDSSYGELERIGDLIAQKCQQRVKVIHPKLPPALTPVESIRRMLRYDPQTSARYEIVSEIIRGSGDDLDGMSFRLIMEMERSMQSMKKTSLDEGKIFMMRQALASMTAKLIEIENATRPVEENDMTGTW